MARYKPVPSLVRGYWLVSDTVLGCCLRSRGVLCRFSEWADAQAAADRLNTERIICRSCRHKVLKAESNGRVCAECISADLSRRARAR